MEKKTQQISELERKEEVVSCIKYVPIAIITIRYFPFVFQISSISGKTKQNKTKNRFIPLPLSSFSTATKLNSFCSESQ